MTLESEFKSLKDKYRILQLKYEEICKLSTVLVSLSSNHQKDIIRLGEMLNEQNIREGARFFNEDFDIFISQDKE